MTLIVEDGTGLATANVYADVAYADAYFALRGNTEWAALDAAGKDAALIKGTDFADIRWGRLLRGWPLKTDQALEFPRNQIYDRYGRPLAGVPEDWKKAVCEYALQSSKGPLNSSPPAQAQEIKRKKTVVGPVTTEVEYTGTESAADYIPYPKADALAAKFAGYGGARAVRA